MRTVPRLTDESRKAARTTSNIPWPVSATGTLWLGKTAWSWAPLSCSTSTSKRSNSGSSSRRRSSTSLRVPPATWAENAVSSGCGAASPNPPRKDVLKSNSPNPRSTLGEEGRHTPEVFFSTPPVVVVTRSWMPCLLTSIPVTLVPPTPLSASSMSLAASRRWTSHTRLNGERSRVTWARRNPTLSLPPISIASSSVLLPQPFGPTSTDTRVRPSSWPSRMPRSFSTRIEFSIGCLSRRQNTSTDSTSARQAVSRALRPVSRSSRAGGRGPLPGRCAGTWSARSSCRSPP